jgi:hypothetical protein
MSDIEEKNIKSRGEAIAESVNEATDKIDPQKNLPAWIKMIGDKFVKKKVARFPALCEETRYVNYKLKKDAEAYGFKGKFTESYGWNEKRDQKLNYSIPNELYILMTNMFDRYFWRDENEKVKGPFMKMICRGDPAWQIWLWVKKQYGHDPEDRAKEVIKFGGFDGSDNQKPSGEVIGTEKSIPDKVRSGNMRDSAHPLTELKNKPLLTGFLENSPGDEGRPRKMEEKGPTPDKP